MPASSRASRIIRFARVDVAGDQAVIAVFVAGVGTAEQKDLLALVGGGAAGDEIRGGDYLMLSFGHGGSLKFFIHPDILMAFGEALFFHEGDDAAVEVGPGIQVSHAALAEDFFGFEVN